mmetsp:Transcript_37973/g.114769  ORF Transcript_37973/g.114769 Transcript_37973/m.114769 type:complete len:322 (-) Transcript_37973:1625-2590(-)
MMLPRTAEHSIMPPVVARTAHANLICGAMQGSLSVVAMMTVGPATVMLSTSIEPSDVRMLSKARESPTVRDQNSENISTVKLLGRKRSSAPKSVVNATSRDRLMPSCRAHAAATAAPQDARTHGTPSARFTTIISRHVEAKVNRSAASTGAQPGRTNLARCFSISVMVSLPYRPWSPKPPFDVSSASSASSSSACRPPLRTMRLSVSWAFDCAAASAKAATSLILASTSCAPRGESPTVVESDGSPPRSSDVGLDSPGEPSGAGGHGAVPVTNLVRCPWTLLAGVHLAMRRWYCTRLAVSPVRGRRYSCTQLMSSTRPCQA